MKTLSENFQLAAHDYLLLLEKGYPQKAILKLAGDRYKLSGLERSVLYRGVAVKSKSESRKDKLLTEIDNSSCLTIDTFNQLITIGSYLNGNFVFIGSDGFLRDASEIHGKALRDDLLQRSTDLISGYLLKNQIKNTIFYIDKQIVAHSRVAKMISTFSSEKNPEAGIVISGSVDKEIIGLRKGVIASSDSQIIDRAMVPVFDLARAVLKYHFNPLFPDLNILINKNL